MGLVKGGFQRLLQTALYAIIFLCAAVIIGTYSYFLSVKSERNIPITNMEKAVEGISGAAVLYLIFAVCLTCCLGGIAAFAFVAIVLDVLFAAAMIAVAVMTRDGASSCTGNVQTPLGDGPVNQGSTFGNQGFGSGANENVTYSVALGTACRLNTAAFACAIIAALLFLVTAAMQVLLVRHHKKEKRFGPSPSNNYTSGYGKKRFGFGRKKNTGAPLKEPETGTAGYNANAPPADNRISGETGYTGTTYGNSHSGYYGAPTGTAVSNPYGYDYNKPSTNY